MPIHVRLKYNSAYYDLIARGDNSEAIFHDEN